MLNARTLEETDEWVSGMSDTRRPASGEQSGLSGTELTQQRMRHDVRQSLGTVMLLAAIMDRDPLGGRATRGALKQMQHEVEWMKQVVAGFDEDPADLMLDVGEAVGAIWGSVAQARRCTMRYVRESDLWAWADPVSLGRAVRNLVDNALRAAGGGVVEVRVSGDARWVAIEVHDSGPGLGLIRPQLQLGMITVRRFASAYDGRLVFDTSPLGGALVRLELPRVSPVVNEDFLTEVDAATVARRKTE